MLDQTCFYPRRGGQDWDTGTITSGDGVMHVEEVRLDGEGNVHHIGTMHGTPPAEGAEVLVEVDARRRELNSRIHSAGHLIDLAVDRLGFAWMPGRGAHYPYMSFVEYSGENEIRFMPTEEMHTVCQFVPDYISANKPGRVVMYHGDFGVPCGGTYVKNLSEIGRVGIAKVKKKDKAIRVSYLLA